MRITLIALLILIGLGTAMFGPRICGDIIKKRNYANTYAIQNAAYGKAVRVRDAGIADGTEIVLYRHKNWECMTWQLIELEDSAYLLKNLYTQKAFQPSSAPEAGVGLWQQTLGGSRFQYWELLVQPGEMYLIRLKGTEMYITATSGEDNSALVLLPRQDANNQLWRLLRQNPIV